MRRLIRVFTAVILLMSITQVRAAESFTDDSGRRIEIRRPFTRIISLYAAHSENLFSLGSGKEIIGVSPHEDYPPAVLKKPVFHSRDDPERFLAARPDLVLIRPMIFRGRGSLVTTLEQAGVTVVSLQPRTVEEMYRYWRRLGLLTGRVKAAREMERRFRSDLARVKDKSAEFSTDARPRVFFESIHRRMKTFSPDSTAIFVLEAAGGVNLATDAKPVRSTNIAAYGKERIMALAERMDVYLAQEGPMNKVTKERILEEPGFRAIRAVSLGRVFLVPERIVSRPTLRLSEGMNRIHDLLYPGGKPLR
jgi:iron complex transport system substrate-binding protein